MGGLAAAGRNIVSDQPVATHAPVTIKGRAFIEAIADAQTDRVAISTTADPTKYNVFAYPEPGMVYSDHWEIPTDLARKHIELLLEGGFKIWATRVFENRTLDFTRSKPEMSTAPNVPTAVRWLWEGIRWPDGGSTYDW